MCRCVAAWAVTSLLFSMAVFATYCLSGHTLTAPVLFTSLALFNTLIAPLNSLPWVINGVVEALVSVDRLQTFLALQEVRAFLSFCALFDSILHCSSACVILMHCWPHPASLLCLCRTTHGFSCRVVSSS